MTKISTTTAAHYAWGDKCDGWHLVTQLSLGVIQERMPAGTAEVNHLHHHARQFFHILAGTALMDLDGARLTLETGERLEIPPQVPHRISNPGPAELHFLVISQPHSHGDREVVPGAGR
jgi:mannose-6-phosphate isomerase-like protein (cupin superfamily)